MTKLYKIVKERWEPEYEFKLKGYRAPERANKRETVITDRRGRVTQTIKHAKRHNEDMQRRQPERYALGLCTRYKVYVSIAEAPDFLPYAAEGNE